MYFSALPRFLTGQYHSYFQREEIGIKLHILPTVNKDGFITTKVTPEVSSIYDFIGPDRNIPWIKKRTSSTTIRVKNDDFYKGKCF